MMSVARRFAADTSGVAIIEYALIAAAIGIVGIAGLELALILTSKMFSTAAAGLSSPSSSGH